MNTFTMTETAADPSELIDQLREDGAFAPLLHYLTAKPIPEEESMRIQAALAAGARSYGADARGSRADFLRDLARIDNELFGRDAAATFDRFNIAEEDRPVPDSEAVAEANAALAAARGELAAVEAEANRTFDMKRRLDDLVRVRHRALECIEGAETLEARLKEESARLDEVIDHVGYNFFGHAPLHGGAQLSEVITCYGRKHAIGIALKDHAARIAKMKAQLTEHDGEIQRLSDGLNASKLSIKKGKSK